jgi:hypothetical protein
MSRRQKRIVAILAIANTLVIATLMTLMLPAITNRPPPHSNSQQVPLQEQVVCQWQATQLLARAGIGGTVTLTPQGVPSEWPSRKYGLLRFQLAHPLAPGETIDEAAQWIWAVFDVALALQERAPCAPIFQLQGEKRNAPFTDVEVTIVLVQDIHDGGQPIAQITASVSAADLVAFGVGEMSEGEFIERVSYAIDLEPEHSE